MKKKFNQGLFIGRFQPFHKGHLYALEVASSFCKKLVIGIGSSQESGTAANPLSAKARIRIIKAGIRGTHIKTSNLKFIEIPDFRDNDAWFEYIIKKEPKIDIIFSRNALVKEIFLSHGIPVISPEWYKRKTFVATRIRGLIKSGKRWQGCVPKGAVNEITAHESTIKEAESRTTKRS